MTKILMVAEKPSVASALAKVLCGSAPCRVDGGRVPAHHFDGVFPDIAAGVSSCCVTSVAGHLFSIDFPEAYQDWDAVDPVELFLVRPQKKCENWSVEKHLRSCARGVDFLVLWLDCDREGENICFEVMSCVEPHMRHAHVAGTQQVLRAKFSALTANDIAKAMATLGEPNENESLAVDARQEIDLKVGVAFSRYQTRYFAGKYSDLNSRLISYGPCQTPALGLCVERHDAIARFQPEPFWQINAQLHVPVAAAAAAAPVPLHWQRGRLFDHGAAEALMVLVQDAADRASSGDVIVETIVVKRERKMRPRPMNTVEMLRLASRVLGISPKDAMRAAEHLYLDGLISYPRTESSGYPSELAKQLPGVVLLHVEHDEWGAIAATIVDPETGAKTGRWTAPRHGTDAGDHPPIMPCRCAEKGELSGREARLYSLVVREFLASLMPDCAYVTTTATLLARSEVSGCAERFTCRGLEVVDPGFTALITSKAMAEVTLPPLREGERVALQAVALCDGFTSPPSHLKEHELLTLMERHEIGTDASMATHIANICDRNYVELGAGRTLVPTALGVTLVHGYHRIDPELVLPKCRAAIEEQCALIANGQASKAAVVAASLDLFKRKFEHFVKSIALMDELFEATFSAAESVGVPLSRCGKCNLYMTYYGASAPPPQRLVCTTCDEVHRLPSGGIARQWTGHKCPLDGFELVIFDLGSASKTLGNTYPVCPLCYSRPPDVEDAPSSSMGCNRCPITTCPHAAPKWIVCPCPGGGGKVDTRPQHMKTRDEKAGVAPRRAGPCPGSLLLSESSKPNWKLGCNVCDSVVAFKGRRVETLRCAEDELCTLCSSTIVVCTFIGGREPEWLRAAVEEAAEATAGGDPSLVTLEYRGCVVCDPNLNALTEFKAPRRTHISIKGRGRGKGGKGGGRGGGRGGKGKRDGDGGGRGKGGKGGGKGGGREGGGDRDRDRKSRDRGDGGKAAPKRELNIEF